MVGSFRIMEDDECDRLTGLILDREVGGVDTRDLGVPNELRRIGLTDMHENILQLAEKPSRKVQPLRPEVFLCRDMHQYSLCMWPN